MVTSDRRLVFLIWCNSPFSIKRSEFSVRATRRRDPRRLPITASPLPEMTNSHCSQAGCSLLGSSSLVAPKKPAEFVVYPDTPHAFFADYRPSYRKQPAEDGWQRMRKWFEAHGVK